MAAYKYLAIGDVWMTDMELSERATPWQRQIPRLMAQEGIALAEPVEVVEKLAITSQIVERLKTSALEPDFDLVLLQVGAWDIMQGTPRGLYALAVSDVLDEAIRLARGDGSHVVVVTPPLMGPVEKESHLQRFAEMIHAQFDQVMERGTPHFVDMVQTSIDLTIEAGEEDGPGLGEDGMFGPPAQARFAEQVAHTVAHVFGSGGKLPRSDVLQFRERRTGTDDARV